MDQSRRTIDWNVTSMSRDLTYWLYMMSVDSQWYTLENRIRYGLKIIQHFYYPILAIVGIPLNLVTITILSRGKCGLSKCITHYLVAMAVADLLVIIFDLILRHIVFSFDDRFYFRVFVPLCNIHAVLLHAVTDCSVYFTVTFTFDRFVAICCQKLKSKYCSEKTATVVLGTVTVLSCLKNIFWYFMFLPQYRVRLSTWFCEMSFRVQVSQTWGTIEFLHYILNPAVPFILILFLNGFTVRHIIVSSRVRKRLLTHSNEDSSRDPEMENRRKSIILLFVISGNFIILWALLMFYFIWYRMISLGYQSIFLHPLVLDLGFMLQLLSCCTNTCIYAMTQTKFREQLKNMLKCPFTVTLKSIH